MLVEMAVVVVKLIVCDAGTCLGSLINIIVAVREKLVVGVAHDAAAGRVAQDEARFIYRQ